MSPKNRCLKAGAYKGKERSTAVFAIVISKSKVHRHATWNLSLSLRVVARCFLPIPIHASSSPFLAKASERSARAIIAVLCG